MVHFGVLRSGSMLRDVVALTVLVAAGCSGGDGGVVVVDSGSGGVLAGDLKPEYVFDAGLGDGVEDESVPVVSRSVTVGVVSDDTGGGQGQTPTPGGPDGGAPGPGDPDDGANGLVGDTGGPVEAVVLPGGYAELIDPEVVGGGLMLLPEPSFPVGLVNEVLDLCDDSAAFFMANKRVLGPGEVATEEELFQVVLQRAGSVDCDESGGRRYIYVGDGWSTSIAHPTVAEALADRDRLDAGNVDVRKRSPKGVLLGYHGMFKRAFPLEERDEIVVLPDTVSVKDGIVRGLVHNLSEKRYARNVVVAVGGLSWRWPLTVQPGERAPFEIEGWEGSGDPANLAVSVTADMSTDIDLSRAFRLGEYRHEPQRDDYVLMGGYLTAPTSPPGLERLIKQQTISDLRAFFAILDINNGTVIEVVQEAVHYSVWHDDGTTSDPRTILVDSYPVSPDSLPEHHTFLPDWQEEFLSGINVDSYTNYDIQVWFGGANPPPTE